jgi:predicted TIM-barrel fold metal-dependent hydrolase
MITKVFDSHTHLFPRLDGACGFSSRQAHFAAMQRHSYSNVNPVRRLADGQIIPDPGLWNGVDLGRAGLADVNFHVGRHGRLQWERDGEEVYVQVFSPSFDPPQADPDWFVAEMDYAGVDMAVVQQGYTYGKLNTHIGEWLARHPSRLVGLAQIEEANAADQEQLSELERCAALGFSGLFYSTMGLWESSYSLNPASSCFAPFWREVCSLGWVVFWDVNTDEFPPGRHADELGFLRSVLDAWPELRVVLVQAFPCSEYFVNGVFTPPAVYDELLKHEQTLFEVAIPIGEGGREEYPYEASLSVLSRFCERVPPERLVWGSDMPAVNRFCTYRQSYEFLQHADFLTTAQLAGVLGDNVRRVFADDA